MLARYATYEIVKDYFMFRLFYIKYTYQGTVFERIFSDISLSMIAGAICPLTSVIKSNLKTMIDP